MGRSCIEYGFISGLRLCYEALNDLMNGYRECHESIFIECLPLHLDVHPLLLLSALVLF
jgi:hypothetical protein